MDISPLPRNPLHPPGQLRLLEPVVYDGGDFATYPERQDWGPRTAVEWVCLFDEPPTEFSALLERWILFGPLSVALSLLQNPPSTLAEFIREIPSDEPTAGRAVFDTQHLVQLLADIALLREDWVASINALSGDATMDVRIMSLTSMILLARRLSQQLLPAPRTYKDDMSFGNEGPLTLVTFLSRYTMRDPRGPGVATATSMVLEMLLGDPRVDRQGNSPGDTMNKEKSGRSMQRRSSELWTRFRQAGWCPAELLRLWAKFDTCSLHYLYNMPRPRPDEHHETAGPNEYFGPGGDGDPPKPKSQYCTIFRCAHRQLQDATYQRAHAEGCNGCGDAVADQAELADILERGSIPLILSVADDDDDESMVNITLVGAEPDMSYVAISHVWSDGLGNVDCNAIPLCQLRRLSKMIRNLPGANADMLLFWLDTICVPPDSARMDRVQRLALSKMRNVYQDATTVLVLDSWLFHGGAAQDMSDAEKILKALCCTWNSRLWTYQEGNLPSSLLFQFGAGSVYDLDAGIKALRETADVATQLTLLGQLMTSHHDLRGCRGEGMTEERIGAISAALSTRTTSVASDEALCVGVLLDLDVGRIAQAAPEERMQVMWSMTKTREPGQNSRETDLTGGVQLPRGLLFEFRGPTLKADGYRWAPSSFLGVMEGDIRKGSIEGPGLGMRLLSQGLYVQSSGMRVVVGPSALAIGPRLFVRDEQTRTWIICVVQPRPGNPDWPPEVHGCKEIAFIERLDWRSVELQSLGAISEHHAMEAIMVRVDREQRSQAGNHFIQCTKLYPVKMHPVSRPDQIAKLDAMLPASTVRWPSFREVIDSSSGTLLGGSGKTLPWATTMWVMK